MYLMDCLGYIAMQTLFLLHVFALIIDSGSLNVDVIKVPSAICS